MWCVQEFRVNTNLGESPLHPLFVLLTEIADTEFQWRKMSAGTSQCQNIWNMFYVWFSFCLTLTARIVTEVHSSCLIFA